MGSRRHWLALLAWLLPGGVLADAVADGLDAWRLGDYGRAHASWLPAARAGDPQAMFLLSELYARGRGVAADQAQALSWLHAAAEGGYAPACYNLGDRYLNGRGVGADAAQAALWWRRAATQGLMLAQYNLGTLYYRGLGVPQDRVQAAWWYRQAATQGSEPARQALLALQQAGVELPEEAPASGTQAGEPPPPTDLVPQSPPEPDAAAPEAPVVAPSIAPAVAFGQLALGPDWLRQQPGDHFTLQVFASTDPDAVRRFLTRYRFSRQVAVYPFSKAGERWYGVTYGRFASKRQAGAALAELPAPVRKGRPWVREMREVTDLLDREPR